MKKLVPILLLLASFSGFSQPTIQKVLFLGNSYTYVNNLPGLVAALAHYSGDSLYFDSNTPGGYTLGWQPTAHVSDASSLTKIQSVDWDFVVLQEQSQTPAIPVLRDSCMLPASVILRDSVKSNHACSRVLFYLTWGRRFGGIQCFTTNYCSTNFSGFDQMQDSVTRSYKLIADSLDEWISPVGEAWRFVLQNSNMVLHDQDQSHPNLKGSYLAACVFYDVIFHKRSFGNAYTGGLLTDTAHFLQLAADSIVFHYSSYWNIWKNEPTASFLTTLHDFTLRTDNTSTNATRWLWEFGDGETSQQFEPIHQYASAGDFTVTLTACDSCKCDTARQVVSVVVNQVAEPERLVKVFHSPDGTWVWHCEQVSSEGTLQLFDVSGRWVLSRNIHAGKAIVENLQPGWYGWIMEGANQKQVRGSILVSER